MDTYISVQQTGRQRVILLRQQQTRRKDSSNPVRHSVAVIGRWEHFCASWTHKQSKNITLFKVENGDRPIMNSLNPITLLHCFLLCQFSISLPSPSHQHTFLHPGRIHWQSCCGLLCHTCSHLYELKPNDQLKVRKRPEIQIDAQR